MNFVKKCDMNKIEESPDLYRQLEFEISKGILENFGLNIPKPDNEMSILFIIGFAQAFMNQKRYAEAFDLVIHSLE